MRISTSGLLIAAVSLLLAAAVFAQDDEGWTLDDAGFETPESVYWDEEDDVYYVSNLGGPQPLKKDGNGFISKLSSSGTVLDLKWITGAEKGLNAPKGMGRRGAYLLVTDIDVLRVFEIESGLQAWEVPLPGATFANDVYVGEDAVYVTDTGADQPGAVYEVTFPKSRAPVVKTRVRDKGLHGPNGILARDGEVYTVAYGGNELFVVHLDGSFEARGKAPSGSLDGLVALNDGRLAFSSWEGKAVYTMEESGEVKTLFENLESPADIGYDRSRDLLLIPQFMKDTVIAKPVR